MKRLSTTATTDVAITPSMAKRNMEANRVSVSRFPCDTIMRFPKPLLDQNHSPITAPIIDKGMATFKAAKTYGRE